MEQNNQKLKPRMGTLMKTIIYTLLFISIISGYLAVTKKEEKNGFNTVLYSGEGKMQEKKTPSKLNWVDSFKGIDNMAK